MDLTTLPLPLVSAHFAGMAVLIGVFGVLLCKEADQLADVPAWAKP